MGLKITTCMPSWGKFWTRYKEPNGHFWSCWSVAQSCLTLGDPMDHSTPGSPVLHRLLELAQTHVHGVGDAIQPSHPLSPPSPPAFNLSQHQGLFHWVRYLNNANVKLWQMHILNKAKHWKYGRPQWGEPVREGIHEWDEVFNAGGGEDGRNRKSGRVTAWES